MDFVLALHSHLPYVLHHGRWPHGSDWLCEAALDTYLPLVEQLQQLAEQDVPSPVTIGFTPVLANQLASAAFAQELEAFFDQREAACQEAPASLAATGDTALLPLVSYWQARFRRLRDLFHSLDHDLVTAFRRFQDAGRLEIIGSAATHGYLRCSLPTRVSDCSSWWDGMSTGGCSAAIPRAAGSRSAAIGRARG